MPTGLGRGLAPEILERVDGWFASWEAAQERRTNVVGAPVRQRKSVGTSHAPAAAARKIRSAILASTKPRVLVWWKPTATLCT